MTNAKSSLRPFWMLALTALTLLSSQASASGGPTEEVDYHCTTTAKANAKAKTKAKGGKKALLRFRLNGAYSSELRGDALAYADEKNLAQMLTSLQDCYEVGNIKVDPAPGGLPAGPLDAVVACGNAEAGNKQLKANNAGYRAVLWRKIIGQSLEVGGRLERAQNGRALENVFGDLTCTAKKPAL